MSCVTMSPISQLSAGPVAFPVVSRSVLTNDNGRVSTRRRFNAPALALASARGRKCLRGMPSASDSSKTAGSSSLRTPLALVANSSAMTSHSITTAVTVTTTTTTTTPSTTIVPRSALVSVPKPARREKRSVRFSPKVDCAYTHPSDEYDRSAQPMAQLSFRDFAEMLQVRAALRRQMEEAVRDAADGRIAKGNLPAIQAMKGLQMMHT